MTLRPLAPADLPALLALDAATNSHPWHPDNWCDSLASHYCLGLWDGDALLGFAVASRVLDEAELLAIAIAPTRQRQGLGRFLLEAVQRQLAQAGAATLFLEVRAGNRPAQALYDALGGTETGIRARYYPLPGGGREDAHLYAFTLAAQP
ncbi:ribosomal-protein-alanine acetyltransferase [Chitiniphilus shinanonensis]|uniref:[Ribosomal protein bS18]-alanine N-acetyltransferase n=1 Tax=Chitiniphilus shinanonensis TaxID=553088 RepID=A0ABQ6BRT2_9NEIS|nr:ribosomal protein S18-alanine N-acetyltransferase [Chitiniphilus shinanonensis]GLS04491.1 ribosomal-protein-alanine acetyltransferase [Chitiniphilus shinanonensis]